jgi:hypothetical protein
MTQRDIDRAVERATGETVGRVRQMGFTLVVVPPLPLLKRHPVAAHRTFTKRPTIDNPLSVISTS